MHAPEQYIYIGSRFFNFYAIQSAHARPIIWPSCGPQQKCNQCMHESLLTQTKLTSQSPMHAPAAADRQPKLGHVIYVYSDVHMHVYGFIFPSAWSHTSKYYTVLYTYQLLPSKVLKPTLYSNHKANNIMQVSNFN